MRRTLLTGLVYVLAACAFTWPLVLHLRSLFGAIDATGDPSLYLWTLGWDLHTISTHPTWLLTGRVFDAPVFFPAHHTLAYSDHLLLQAVALWPVYVITHDLVLCYNVLLIASLAASALAACDQDTYSSNPEDRKAHMGDDIHFQGAPVPAPTAAAPH